MFPQIDAFLDPVLIVPFQGALALTGSAEAAFVLGVLTLCLACVMLGELCMAGAYAINREHFVKAQREMVTHNNLSIQAIAQKDKHSYWACNKLANEAFGLSFFSGLALFASSVWPAFFALSWIDFRFAEADIAFWGVSVSYPAVFIPLYILTRVVFARYLKRRIWPFSRIAAWVDASEKCTDEMMTWADLAPQGERKP